MKDFLLYGYLNIIDAMGNILYLINRDESLRIDHETQTVSVGRSFYRGLGTEPGWEERTYKRAGKCIEETVIIGDGVSYMEQFAESNILSEKEMKKKNKAVWLALRDMPYPDETLSSATAEPVEA